MTFGSLFAGIGGFDLGLERAGLVCRWQVEIDPFARAVLAKHWPDVRRYKDVRQVHGLHARHRGLLAPCEHCLEPVDVICGGFPCQDISVANTDGDGLDGERSGLWFHFARLIGELRPRYALVENVANLFNRGISDVLGDLAALGYDAEWTVIRASDVGAPHVRERVWIVAYPERAGLSGRVEGPRVFGAAPTAFTEPGDTPFGSWRDVDATLRGVPHLHGVSVQMVRDRIKAYGNAVVPQIPEWIGRRLIAIEADGRSGWRSPLAP